MPAPLLPLLQVATLLQHLRHQAQLPMRGVTAAILSHHQQLLQKLLPTAALKGLQHLELYAVAVHGLAHAAAAVAPLLE
jgi:hypothetical protein